MGYYGQSYVREWFRFPLRTRAIRMSSILATRSILVRRNRLIPAMMAVNDEWKIRSSQELQLSGFFRSYNLSLYSDFGQGLIRKVIPNGGVGPAQITSARSPSILRCLPEYETTTERLRAAMTSTTTAFSIPRLPVTTARLLPSPRTMSRSDRYHRTSRPRRNCRSPTSRYYQVSVTTRLISAIKTCSFPQHSFQNRVGVTRRKRCSRSCQRIPGLFPCYRLASDKRFSPTTLRIGTGASLETPVSTAHSYQLVASKTIRKTDVRLTLGHVTPARRRQRSIPIRVCNLTRRGVDAISRR